MDKLQWEFTSIRSHYFDAKDGVIRYEVHWKRSYIDYSIPEHGKIMRYYRTQVKRSKWDSRVGKYSVVWKPSFITSSDFVSPTAKAVLCCYQKMHGIK